MESVLAFLDGTSSFVTVAALTSFVVLNVGFIAYVALRRDRSAVNRFTKPLVIADTALLLAAGGAPVANWAVGTSVRAVALVMPGGPTVTAAQDGPAAVEEIKLDPLTGQPVAP